MEIDIHKSSTELATQVIENNLWGQTVKITGTDKTIVIPSLTEEDEKIQGVNLVKFFNRSLAYIKNTSPLSKKNKALADSAKALYRAGLTTEEVAEKMNKAVSRINQYYVMAGGISQEDKAHHMKNRYLKD